MNNILEILLSIIFQKYVSVSHGLTNDVEFCRNSTDAFCFIHKQRIVLTHIIVLVSRNNMLYETTR